MSLKMTNLAKESKPYNMLQDKDIKKIQELKADYTPCRVSAEDIISRFKALKLTKGLSHFNYFKQRGYDFETMLFDG